MDPDQEQTPSDAAMPSGMMEQLEAILATPETMNRLRQILRTGPSESPTAEEPPFSDFSPDPVTEASKPSGAGASPLADGLSSVLSNPAMMAKLPQIMELLRPMIQAPPTRSSSHPDPHKSPETCRNDLLLALKPFLSPERREAVDVILHIAQLGNILRQLDRG